MAKICKKKEGSKLIILKSFLSDNSCGFNSSTHVDIIDEIQKAIDRGDIVINGETETDVAEG